MSDLDLAYAAGIIDGEGCIYVHKSAIRMTPKLEIKMGEYPCVEFFQSVFGGTVSKLKVRKNGYRVLYRWVAQGENALCILESLLPYLKGKKEQALELLTWPNRNAINYGKRGMPQAVKEMRSDIHQNLRKLKLYEDWPLQKGNGPCVVSVKG